MFARRSSHFMQSSFEYKRARSCFRKLPLTSPGVYDYVRPHSGRPCVSASWPCGHGRACPTWRSRPRDFRSCCLVRRSRDKMNLAGGKVRVLYIYMYMYITFMYTDLYIQHIQLTWRVRAQAHTIRARVRKQEWGAQRNLGTIVVVSALGKCIEQACRSPSCLEMAMA